MASSKNFVEFVVDQIEDASQITYKYMFGEYRVFSDGKNTDLDIAYCLIDNCH